MGNWWSMIKYDKAIQRPKSNQVLPFSRFLNLVSHSHQSVVTHQHKFWNGKLGSSSIARCPGASSRFRGPPETWGANCQRNGFSSVHSSFHISIYIYIFIYLFKSIFSLSDSILYGPVEAQKIVAPSRSALLLLMVSELAIARNFTALQCHLSPTADVKFHAQLRKSNCEQLRWIKRDTKRIRCIIYHISIDSIRYLIERLGWLSPRYGIPDTSCTRLSRASWHQNRQNVWHSVAISEKEILVMRFNKC